MRTTTVETTQYKGMKGLLRKTLKPNTALVWARTLAVADTCLKVRVVGMCDAIDET